MGTCASITCSLEFEDQWSNANNGEQQRKDSFETNHTIFSATSNGIESALSTKVDFSLFENQKPLEEYKEQIAMEGKYGAVRDFLKGCESASLCWLAFADDSTYMSKEELDEFFEYCLLYVSKTIDASLQAAFYFHEPYEMYQEFVVRLFGRAKTRLNQREFWHVADSVQAKFEVERSSSVETVNIGYYRKQSLVKVFYLCEEDERAKIERVIFKLFGGGDGINGMLSFNGFRDLVYHSIIFFSQKQEDELECSGPFWKVLNEVVEDVLQGEKLTELDFPRFCRAAMELRDVFEKLITHFKIRDEQEAEERARKEQMGFTTPDLELEDSRSRKFTYSWDSNQDDISSSFHCVRLNSTSDACSVRLRYVNEEEI